MDGSVIHEPYPSFFLIGSVPSSTYSYYASFSRSTDFADHRMPPWAGGMSPNVHLQFPFAYCTSARPLKPVNTAVPAPAFPYRTNRFSATNSPQCLHRKRQSRGRERPIRTRSKGIRGYRIPEGKFPRLGASTDNSRAAWWNDASPSSPQQRRQRYARASVSSPAPLMPRSPRNTSSFIIRQHESFSSPAPCAVTSPLLLQRPDAFAAAFAGDSASPRVTADIAAITAAAAAAGSAGACATGDVPCDNSDHGNSEEMPGLAPDLADMADMAPLLSVNPYGSMSGCIRLRTPEPVPYDREERSEGNSQGMRIFPRDMPLVSRAECSEGASCSEDSPRESAAHKEERVAVAGFDVRFFEVVCDMLVVAPACDADAPGRDVVASHAAAACNDTAAAAAVACAADGSDSILRARIDEQEAQMAQLEEENHSLRDRLEMRQEELRRLRSRLLSHNSAAIEVEGETDGTQLDAQRTSASTGDVATTTAAAAAVATTAPASHRRSASPSSARAAVRAAVTAAGECNGDGYMSSS
ncbi:unnamed protein product [Closterium sp. NIES-53]